MDLAASAVFAGILPSDGLAYFNISLYLRAVVLNLEMPLTLQENC